MAPGLRSITALLPGRASLDPRRIVFVLSDVTSGDGLTASVLALASFLAEQHGRAGEVEVVSVGSVVGDPAVTVRVGVTHVGDSKDGLRDLLARRRPSVVVTTTASLHRAVVRLADRRHLLVGLEAVSLADQRGDAQSLMTEVMLGLDLLVVPTEADAEARRAAWSGAGAEVAQVVAGALPSPVPVADRPPALEAHRLVAAGRLVESSGVDLLVDAWAEVAPEFPDWVLDIYGQGPCEADIRRQAAEVGVRDRVQLHGWVADVHDRLRDSSGLIRLATYGSFPGVVLESLSLGVPVIVSADSATARALVTDQVEGRLVPCDRGPGPVADVLRELIRDPGTRHAWGEAALKRARAFAVEPVASAWVSILERAVAARGR